MFVPQFLGTFFILRFISCNRCSVKLFRNLSFQSLEHALATGEPFPCLETLVMRDMYMSRFQTESCPFEEQTWNHKMNSSIPGTGLTVSRTHPFQPEDVDWNKASHLLLLSDLLNARHLGFSSIAPDGIGLSSSVREVGHLSQSHGLRLADLPVRPFDLFVSLINDNYFPHGVE